MASTHKRHIAKAITWRIVGTIDTIILSWIVTGNPFTGIKIGLSEVITKMFLYYFHERIWFNIKAGITKNGDSRKRHIAKTITWRVVGTLDTMLLAWWISGNSLTGLKIGGIELITKMIFYYLHERAWYKYDFGLQERRNKAIKKKKELQYTDE